MEYSKLPPSAPPPYSELSEMVTNLESPTAPPRKDDHGYAPVPAETPVPAVAPIPAVPPVQSPQLVNVMNQTIVIDSAGQGMICPHCNARVRMRVKHHATGKTYCLAFFLCLFLCWPCVCAPCCCNWCYKTSQFCPNCNACLGSF
ncbi:CG42565 [Drosophila busckii]|uniref:CG42565 n=2 Tax=Drosophila busckii TaxID=30019 RepID=A0A0M4EWK9_DROBS|nr:lipopolysaccharide-induced tumor necrosis factor-alpha factor homolog isoform X2 [Drosophila busckii]ALC42500.1 CG42565 [Drosophila busckii]